MAKIFVTGATGFIGKRLTYALLEQGHEVFASVRIRGTFFIPYEKENLHLVYGDLRHPTSFDALPEQLDVAFYLMHSMSDIVKGLVELECQIAETFVQEMKKKGVKQIIYLGGIINETPTSSHLESRLQVENILKKSGIPFTILRASIVVGSGSASFEMIQDLVEKLPVMVAPKWINTLCQPIAISDVLYYLKQSILNPLCLNRTFDIGGPNVLSFKEMLQEYAKIRKLKRYIISVPVLTPHLSSYWLILVTSVKFSLAYYLVQSMKMNTVCLNKDILSVIPHQCLTYSEAIERALLRIKQNEVTSSWRDAWELESSDPDIQKFIEVPTNGVLTDKQKVKLILPREKVIDNIWTIGGDKGWYALEWAWNMRGLIDKLFGGSGLSGHRNKELQAGDALDFWRVIKADKKEGHLILYAEMKIPGEAWLEFKVNHDFLYQTATFRPKGLWGRIYWYSLVPFHYFIFRKMAKKISS